MIRHPLFSAFTLLVFAYAVPPEAASQESRCADCHFANPQADPAPSHLVDWESSPHARNDVGCESCHGGDPSTFESFVAHRGILTSRNPASPVHPTNLPRTCGGCHTGPFVSFQDSRHYQLLREGSADGPNCATCHGPVAARLLAPRGLEKRCASCHGPDGVHPNSDYPPQGRLLLEDVESVREMLSSADRLIQRVEEETRREELERAYQQAEVPLIEAVHSAHSFVFDQMKERLNEAERRAEALLRELANPE